MKKLLFVMIALIMLLSGCSAGAHMPNITSPVPQATQMPKNTHLLEMQPEHTVYDNSSQPTQQTQLHILPTDLSNIENAVIHNLVNQDNLRARPNILGNAILSDGTNLFCSYDEDDDISHLFIDGLEVLRYPWVWTIGTGEYDLTGDGVDELILFVAPMTANSGAGNLHIYDLSAAGYQNFREVLSFWGERYYENAIQVPFNSYDTSLDLPNDFPYGQNPHQYNTKLIGVDVLELDGVFLLRLMNDADQQEIAYSYVLWDKEWKVLGQQLIPG